VTARLLAALGFASLGLLLGGAASATPPLFVTGLPAGARALGVVIIGSDGSPLSATTQLEAPPAGALDSSFDYPYDGTSVSAASISASVTASASDGTASGFVKVADLSLFDGEITASEVRAAVSSAATVGDLSGSDITNLIVLGQSISGPTPGLHLTLADWGTLDALSESSSRGEGLVSSWRGTVTALSIHLDEDHGGLRRGTTVRVGVAEAYSQTPEPGTTTATTGQGLSTTPSKTQNTRPAAKPNPTAKQPTPSPVGEARSHAPRAGKSGQVRKAGGLPVIAAIPDVTPKLTTGRYVFPVYGPSAYGDTFGAPRPDVSGGWHHGDDIFAPFGAPVLAVADGTVFSVGWNDVGGYRLWLRDRGGNEFYYAHLSAYTTLAVNGRQVKAGDVLGFVGNTGDAEGTPFHLHFEVHPVAMLFLGYDGAVNPTKYLDAWKRLEDIRILPAIPFAVPAAVSNAPTPGAILLESSDISTANGLDPGSLMRAMKAPPTVDVTMPRVTELPVPLPVLDRA
jgi:murein DD-endopeptidase MepM/ murein hydrolase activator NlpD